MTIPAEAQATPIQDGPSEAQRVGRRDSWWLFAWAILFWSLTLESYSKLPLHGLHSIVQPGRSKSALLLTAHPDDEAMFFSPTVLALGRDGWTIHGLCLSTGDESGLGHIRRTELFDSYNLLGVSSTNIVILDDPRFQDGMQNHWNTTEIAQVVSKHIEQYPVSLIITFDQQGITHHPNHTPLPSALLSTALPHNPRIALLHSPSLYGKFTGPLLGLYHVNKHFLLVLLDYLPSFAFTSASVGNTLKTTSASRIVVVSSFRGWITGWRAMLQHQSQLVWFRWLYLLFSRLMWINQLDLVDIAG